jgi:thioesterase domain-containing protein/aryl carrier-like protein
VLHGIPNARVFADAVIAGVAEANSLEPIAPADLVTLASAHGLRLRLRPSVSDGPAYMDALWESLTAPGLPFADSPPPAPASVAAATAATTNDPLRAKREHLFLPQLRRYLLDRLPEYMVPADLLLLPQLPQTPSGKLDRGALPPPTRRRTAHYVPPRTAREQVLADAFASVLGHKRIGIHDNFFALGGHSLQTISLVSRAEKAGIALAVRDVYSHPTVAGLATAAGGARQSSCVIPLAAGEQPGTLVFVPAVGGHLTAHLIRLAMAVSGRQSVVGLTTPPHLGRGPDIPAMPTTLPALGRYYAGGLMEHAKAQQTLGQPFTIIGYCFGGFAALEIARALEEAGVPITSVILLESDPPQQSHLPKDLEGPRFDRIAALLRIAALWGLPVDAARLRTLTEDQVIAHLVSVMPDADIASAYEEATLRAIVDTQQASHGMIDAWQIRGPAAPLHLLRAEEDPDGLPPDYGWSSYAKLASLTTVPGDHHGFIRPPYLAGTATALLQILYPPLHPPRR